ncbi:MAG: beta-phosphoglucomutase [Rectinema sp.]
MKSSTIVRRAAIFDLDGVLVDTAKYHYLAWKKIADTLGIRFTETDNERLKGVGRMECLDIILGLGNVALGQAEKERLAAEKNGIYLTYLQSMDESALLEGAASYLASLKKAGIPTALASASKNAGAIIDRIGIRGLLDAIVDGTMVRKSKPDPEVFNLAASMLGVERKRCVVFEDAAAGIEAAHAAGMIAVGIGSEGQLPDADFVIPGLFAAGGWFFEL